MTPSKSFQAAELRKIVLDMAYAGSAVHIGCAFSLIEILAVLYRNHLHYPDNNPASEFRDYLVLSKGHGVMAQYACMKELGWLPQSDFEKYFADESNLKGLSDSRIPGLEVTSGSLGHGFSVGVGLALAATLKKTGQKVFVVVGDGEINEGPIWEGALFAAHHQLNNFMVIVDENGFQAMGPTNDILALASIEKKFASFGFDAISADGHDESALNASIQTLMQRNPHQPKALIAKTIKGKGVPFMENNNAWHYTRLNDSSYEDAIAALNQDSK